MYAITELDCSITHLALAWVACHPGTSTVILGASRPEQVLDNLKALNVVARLTDEVLEKVEAILGNRPESLVSAGFQLSAAFGAADETGLIQ